MNEFELINLLTEGAPRKDRDLVAGVGDDCAVIDAGDRNWLVTTDALVEGVHFSLAFSNAYDLGKRIMAVNISDIAAMGGRPRFFTVALGVPGGMSDDRLRKLYDGIYSAAQEHKALLIGGDTVATDQLIASVTVIGEADKKKTILRSGARPGDALCVTGDLGKGALGLECLKAGNVSDETMPFIDWYRVPRPRVFEGQMLAATGFITAMIDISDGLMADVDHLAGASQTGYEIHVEKMPRVQGMGGIAQALKLDPIRLMLGGGDDYELAFTVSRNRHEDFKKWYRSDVGNDLKLTEIGRIIEDPARRVALAPDGIEIDVAKRGYDHFGGNSNA
jgi:thiamine-monophosphate kinase